MCPALPRLVGCPPYSSKVCGFNLGSQPHERSDAADDFCGDRHRGPACGAARLVARGLDRFIQRDDEHVFGIMRGKDAGEGGDHLVIIVAATARLGLVGGAGLAADRIARHLAEAGGASLTTLRIMWRIASAVVSEMTRAPGVRDASCRRVGVTCRPPLAMVA